MKTKLQLYFKKLFAKWMILLGKLPHVEYTVAELNALLQPHFPNQFKVDVPVGSGTFTILEGRVSIKQTADHIDVELMSSLDIESIGTPLYRAHVLVHLQVEPGYDRQSKTIFIHNMKLDNIHLVQDHYALLNNSRNLLDLVLPKSVQSLITGTFKSALGVMTAGSSDLASDYLHLYMTGSKQKVLNYHKPQIQRLIESLKQDPEFVYEMDDNDWQESLFRQYGRTVKVEQGEVRFKF